nr:sigma-70 family RNA polymerase sigma factor [Nocardia nova]
MLDSGSVDYGSTDRRASGRVAAAVADAHRREWAFVLAATVRVTHDLELAEECVQDAYAQALVRWAADGIPSRPAAWLTTVARNHALDLLRRQSTARRALPLLIADEKTIETTVFDAIDPYDPQFPDDRLRLICTCCHPALARQTQVALTLRLVCGLTTAEVARAFLVAEPTMAARITRAKKKIATARIPYRVPGPAELPERIEAVLAVVHLLFTTGHTAPSGDDLIRRDLTERALDLARMLHGLLPDDPEIAGLLALLLLTDARRAARVTPEGAMVALADQDRALGSGGDRTGHRAGPLRAGTATGPLCVTGRDRRRSRRGAQLRRHRLAGDPRALRRPEPDLAFAGGGAQSRRRDRDGRRSRGRLRRAGRTRHRTAAGRVQLPPRRTRALPHRTREVRRGPARLLRGPAADRERGRARISRPPSGRPRPARVRPPQRPLRRGIPRSRA